jgi:urea carboxylase
VEHPVTEAVFGIDLVEWMVQLAAGQPPNALYNLPTPVGASIEVRLCSEEPARDFRPSAGTLQEVLFPNDVRVDSWISSGTEVSPFYDSLLAKIIVHGADRKEAIERMCHALQHTRLIGIGTNLDFLRQVIASPIFTSGDVSLKVLTNYFKYQPNAVEVLEPGTYTTIQDYPGRVGYWDIGVPPSGPMDDYAFRFANRLVGNAENAAGLECTLVGPLLRFHTSTTIAITGATMNATVDKTPVDLWKPIVVQAGQTLRLERPTSGCRSYIAVRGGFDVPLYLGSRSTFVLGKFGGYAGRALQIGDMLFIDACMNDQIPRIASNTFIPHYPIEGEEWQVGVLYGPHGAPDFFTSDYIEKFFATAWQVHYNSNRLGIRLLGPKPTWSRTNGGDAGLHPSNIHDCEYAVGSINFTGDTPIILTQDGPSLGGFVCPVTIAKAELWKIGQVKPNDRIRFYPITFDQALTLERDQDKLLATLITPVSSTSLASLSSSTSKSFDCILTELPATNVRPAVIYRQAGDHYILIEYGSMNLDLRYRFRVHFLMEQLRNHHPVEGILELSPGVRSLQIKYDSRIIHQRQLIAALLAAEDRLPSDDSAIRVKSRIVYLPLTFEDSATLDAVKRYRETVRESAPWLPNNVDFIQRINGLASRADVQKIVFDASYLVLGLGDVYLGAPCAVPIDPRHRIVTSKYNPARTFTAEGTVGIGGVYMCIYGMDSPGGYQLIGRTLPIWNTFTRNTAFKNGDPWLLRFFDQVRFYPVDEAELITQRHAFREGRLNIRIIEDNEFDLGEYNDFLKRESESITNFTTKQSAAFDEEVSHWQKDVDVKNETLENNPEIEEIQSETDGQTNITADICGSVWKLLVEQDQMVEANAPVIILEAMKMELIVRSPIAGKISSILCRVGQLVSAKDILLRIELV